MADGRLELRHMQVLRACWPPAWRKLTEITYGTTRREGMPQSPNSVQGRLVYLRKLGFLDYSRADDGRVVWRLTEAGCDLLDDGEQ